MGMSLMSERPPYPRLQTTCESDLNLSAYTNEAEKIIQHLLPPHFFLGENIKHKLDKQLPLICWTAIKEPPFALSQGQR